MSQPIREENDDVMVTKTRLDDIIKGIKALVTVSFLISLQTVEEATSPVRNPHHMASANKHLTLFSH